MREAGLLPAMAGCAGARAHTRMPHAPRAHARTYQKFGSESSTVTPFWPTTSAFDDEKLAWRTHTCARTRAETKHTRTRTHTHTHTRARARARTLTHNRTHAHTRERTHASARAHTHTDTTTTEHTHARARACTHTRTHAANMHTHTHLCERAARQVLLVAQRHGRPLQDLVDVLLRVGMRRRHPPSASPENIHICT